MKPFPRAVLSVLLAATGTFALEPGAPGDSLLLADTNTVPDAKATVDTNAVAVQGAKYLHDPVTAVREWIQADTAAPGLIERTVAAHQRRNRTATITTLSGAGLTILGFVVGFTTGDCTEQPGGGTHCESPGGVAIAAPGVIAFSIGVGLFFKDTAEEKQLRRRYHIHVMDKRFK